MKVEQPVARLLTSFGTGGMAVVQATGQGVERCIDAIFVPIGNHHAAIWLDDRLLFGRILDPITGETIDEAIVVGRRDGQRGLTININVHGGVRVVERLLEALDRLGVRIVGAFDSIDDAEAAIEDEGAAALARAKTERAVRFVARQIMVLPAALEEIAQSCETDPTAGRLQLAGMLERSSAARFLLEGATVVLAGPPNAGKSTLLNRLFEGARALVSPTAGTTRDWVGVEAAIDGLPIRAIDTAGVRATEDPLEREAIERGMVRLSESDVAVIVVDRSEEFPAEFLKRIAPAIRPDRTIVVLNKVDLEEKWDVGRIGLVGRRIVATCGLNATGLAVLSRHIVETLNVDDVESQPVFFTGRQAHEARRLLSDQSGQSLANALRVRFQLKTSA